MFGISFPQHNFNMIEGGLAADLQWGVVSGPGSALRHVKYTDTETIAAGQSRLEQDVAAHWMLCEKMKGGFNVFLSFNPLALHFYQ